MRSLWENSTARRLNPPRGPGAWQRRRRTDTLSFVVARQVAARTGGGTGAVYLENHDWPAGAALIGVDPRPAGRIADLLCPLPCADVSALRGAALLLLSLPGVPMLWMGQELGLHGADHVAGNGQRWSRNPMAWRPGPGLGFTTAPAPWTPFSADTTSVAAQDGVAGSVLETYRALIRLRAGSAPLRRGSYRELTAARPEVWAFLREHQGQRVLVVFNFSDAAVATTVDLAAAGVTAATATDLIAGATLPSVTPATAAAWPVAVAPGTGRWIVLE